MAFVRIDYDMMIEQHQPLRIIPRHIGYVLKRYPRYSETFVVNEILAHEEAGLNLHLFSLLPPTDSHFQEIIGRVKAPLRYLSYENIKGNDFWQAVEEAENSIPGILTRLELARGEDYRNVYQALLLASAVSTTGIEHLHAHFSTSATTVARLASLFSGVPYTFTAHAKDIYHNDVDHTDLKRKIHDAAAVITVVEYNLNYLRSKFTDDKSKIMLVYNGLNPASFPYSKPEGRNKEIVAVGRLVEKKGFEILINACSLLRSRNIPFHCRIVGTGPLENTLRTQIEQLALHTRVELTGALSRPEMIKYIQEAAVFAVPSVIGNDGDRDGLPTTLLEAMALGTPCISTDVAGIPEVLHDGQTGLMVPQYDAAALADALERLLLNSELGIFLSEKARMLIESKFDIHKNTTILRDLFSRITPEAAKRRTIPNQ
jgi:colanic acid/amylovoran biosynthesis glycosyltransferase